MFKRVTKSAIKTINQFLKQFAALGSQLGVNGVQRGRYMMDCSTGEMVGVDKMNQDNHGWDGVFKNGMYFENKNVKATSKSGVSFAFTFQDTSSTKLQELCDGVIAVKSFWAEDGSRAFSLVGNTSAVSDYLMASYNPNSRNTATVSMSRCMDRGFKLVAGSYGKQKVIDIVSDKFPRLGKTLTTADIYTEKEAKELVASMM